jgi:hypothetical protein
VALEAGKIKRGERGERGEDAEKDPSPRSLSAFSAFSAFQKAGFDRRGGDGIFIPRGWPAAGDGNCSVNRSRTVTGVMAFGRINRGGRGGRGGGEKRKKEDQVLLPPLISAPSAPSAVDPSGEVSSERE